jgi:hypothetical protein
MISKLLDLPIQNRLREIQLAREKWIILEAFNQIVDEMVITDAKIDSLPEGAPKEYQRAIQEEAWDIVLSEEMCSNIVIVE